MPIKKLKRYFQDHTTIQPKEACQIQGRRGKSSTSVDSQHYEKICQRQLVNIRTYLTAINLSCLTNCIDDDRTHLKVKGSSNLTKAT